MLTDACEIIHDDPGVAGNTRDGAAMHHPDLSVTVVFTFQYTKRARQILHTTRTPVCPIGPKKTAQPRHLIGIVYGYAIVKSSPSEGAIERRWRIVAIS